MITGRDVLEALLQIDRDNPEALDESLYATYGNDENGNADVIPVAAILPCCNPTINGVGEPLASDGMDEQPVIVLDDENNTSPLCLLEETLSIYEPLRDRLMQEDFERIKDISAIAADIREGMNAL